MGCSIFPFSSMPSFSVWLTIRRIIQVREGTICSSSCLFCLEYYCFHPVFETNSGLNRKCSLFRVLEYPLFCLCYSILDVTHLLCTCLEFAEFSCIMSSAEFHAHGTFGMLPATGQLRRVRIIHIFSAQMHAFLSHQTTCMNYKFKDNITKNFKTETAEK